MTDKPSSQSTAEVLYIDHKNHPSPLSHTYRLSSSRHLSSSLPSSLSTITEIDSVYCPNCLDFQTAVAEIVDKTTEIARTSITKKRYCSSSTCVQCPICLSPLSISIHKSPATNDVILYYQCEYCYWDSLNDDDESNNNVNLMVNLNKEIILSDNATSVTADGVTDRFDLTIKEGMDVLRNKLNQQISSNGKDMFQSLVENWTLYKSQQDQKQHHNTINDVQRFFNTFTAIPFNKSTIPSGSWSITQLEESLQSKKIQNEKSMYVIDPTQLATLLTRTNEKPSADEELLHVQQIVYNQGTLHPISLECSNLLPIPFTLHSKKIRRCTSKNTSNIIVKPNVNPLFGDTSWRGNHGRWWKKDDSAIHTIPKVKIMQHKSMYYNKICHFLLVKIINPTIGIVRLRFRNSSAIDIDTSDLLINPMENIYMPAMMIKQSTIFVSDTLELQPSIKDKLSTVFSDGNILEKDNAIIQDWLFSIPPMPNKNLLLSPTVASENIDDPLQTKINLIETNYNTAYVEMVIVQDEENDDGSEFLAYPIVMEIEVGDGSWELSCIEPNSSLIENGEIDYVPFPLLFVWDGNNSSTAF